MHFISLIVEQLDRAASELHTDHPINDRWALILVDNATELLVHRQCADLLETHEFDAGLYERYERTVSKLPSNEAERLEFAPRIFLVPKQLGKVRSRSFPDKLNVLRQIGDITEEQQRFIAIAHRYRNDLYHAGLAHDHIVRAICSCYFRVCCELFSEMKQHGAFDLVTSNEDDYGDVFRRYLDDLDEGVPMLGVDRRRLSADLLAALPQHLPNLPRALASSGRMLVAKLNDNFDFVAHNNPQGLDAAQVLEIIQWQQDLATELGSTDHVGNEPSASDEIRLRDAIERMARDWRQQFSAIPYDRWRQTLSRIEVASDPLVAMHQYQALRDDMQYLEDAIEPLVDALDQWVQQEIDLRRGK